MGGSRLRGRVALGLASAMVATGLGGVATAASLPMVVIAQSSESIASIGPSHNPFGPLQSGQTLAEVFTTTQPFNLVGAVTPTWTTKTSGGTLLLRSGAGLGGAVLAQKAFTNVTDGGTLTLGLASPAKAGTYTLELADPTGPSPLGTPPKGGAIGWWGTNAMVGGDYALVNGKKTSAELVTEYQPVAAATKATTASPKASAGALPKTGRGLVPVAAGLLALGAGAWLLWAPRRRQGF